MGHKEIGNTVRYTATKTKGFEGLWRSPFRGFHFTVLARADEPRRFERAAVALHGPCKEAALYNNKHVTRCCQLGRPRESRRAFRQYAPCSDNHGSQRSFVAKKRLLHFF